MNALGRQSDNLLMGQNQLSETHMKQFFNVLKATVVRSRSTMTATFLSVQNVEGFNNENMKQLEDEISLFLATKIRQTDLLFKLSKPFEWCVLLSQSGEEETIAFLERLFSDIKNLEVPLLITSDNAMVASVAEIGNGNVEYEQLMKVGKSSLTYTLKREAWNIEYIDDFKQKDIETVKVSILEENEIFSNVLKASLQELAIEHFNLEINVFKDGYEFLESSFFHSGHTHIVIMNDILPRKNGLEVLHALRKLPNKKKFIIFMMTKRKSEVDMLYAYEKGVDEYLIKPFNLRLFEAQIKRTFERLWS
ncbi:response regulator [Sporosarcina beigongshangi]|uniref:response regulator n=1 Tax=Sporosarcina beigongshangi TaxID=2782538 RepID=UPI00193AAD58|nr:response regulator [Sporosarcina beigongshangi]